MIKRFIIALILLVIVCGGLVGFYFFRANAIKQFFATMQRPAVVVSAVMVEAVEWKPGIDAFGTVYAAEGTDIAVQSGGVVRAIAFQPNDTVTKGQVLVQIDDSVERADLLAAQTSVQLAQRALDRARTLAKTGVTSAVTVDTAEGSFDSATSTLARIEATLDQKSIKAPFPGTIGIAKVNVGQYAQAGTVIATLQNLDKMKVDFTIPEQSLGSLKIGQEATFGQTVESMTLTGTITGIDPKIDPQTRLVSLQAVIDNPGHSLRPGQFIRIRVALPAEDGVIALPQTAVVASLYGDFVFAVEASEAKPATDAAASGAAPAAPGLIAKQIFVKTGRRNFRDIEIVSGVTAGQQIVTAGQNRLSNKTPVKIDNTIDPTKATIEPGT